MADWFTVTEIPATVMLVLLGVPLATPTISVTVAGPVPEDAPDTVIQAGSPDTDQEQNPAVCTPMSKDPPAPGA